MQRWFLLDVVIRKRPTVLQLLPREDEALLVGRDSFLVLDLRLNVIDRVRGLDVKRDRFTSQGLHENLHSTPETQHQVKGRLLLDVVIRKRPTVLQLFPAKMRRCWSG